MISRKKFIVTSAIEDAFQPLVDILNDKYHDAWEGEFAITRGGPFGFPHAALIELPDHPDQFPVMAQALATLLSQTGSTSEWMRSEGETDPYRRPLRFSVVQKTIYIPEMGFLNGSHLMVEGDWDTAAATHQIQLLVAFLQDDSNLENMAENPLT